MSAADDERDEVTKPTTDVALPEWTPERRRAVREALGERRARLIRGSRVFAGLLIATVATGVVLRLPESWWVPVVGAIALAGIAFRLTSWKCPSCGERLPSRRSPAACPGCGAPLD